MGDIMKVHSTGMTVSLLMCTVAGFAAEPPAPTSTPSAATPGQNAATQTAAAPKAPLTTTEETAKQARSLGLSPKVYGGKLVWCKSDTALGTHIATHNCVADNQVAAAAAHAEYSKVVVADMQRNNLSEPHKAD
jgi:hypothetical protein